MRRLARGGRWLAAALAVLWLAPTLALAQAAGPAGADGSEAGRADGTAEDERDEYADDEADYDYVDIDSFGVDEAAQSAGDGPGPGSASASSTTTTADDAAGPAPVAADPSATAGAAAADAGAAPRSLGDRAERAGAVAMDALILRPFGAAATGVGYGFLLVATPFLAFSDGYDTARDVFVGERYRYTFERPIGQF